MELSPVLLLLASLLVPFSHASEQNSDADSLSTTLLKTQSEIVNAHNDRRRNVSPPASNMLKMKWDSAAATNAQNWANQCTYEHSNKEARKIEMGVCGENLFMSNYPASWTEVVKSWDDEKHDFTFNVGPKNSNAMVGHYTQVVWYSSYKVGCAIAKCPGQDLSYFYVCQYCPGGNINTRLYTPYEQGKPCAKCPNDCDNGLCTNSCEYKDEYSNCKSLVEQVKCEHPVTKGSCKASCNCKNKIY